jgi:hypothetical protein
MPILRQSIITLRELNKLNTLSPPERTDHLDPGIGRTFDQDQTLFKIQYIVLYLHNKNLI